MGKKNQGLRIGIETKIEYSPVLDVLGDAYESMRRTGLSRMQSGWSEDDIEKRFQGEFNIQWAWADSLATEVKATYDQLTTAKKLNIARLKEQIKKKTAKAKKTLSALEKRLKAFNKKPRKSKKNPDPHPIGCTSRERQSFVNRLMGLKSKVAKIESLKTNLAALEDSDWLHICFGSKKLFNAQHHLEANGYADRNEWLEDWRKSRGGRFYCVGKGQHGGGTMIKVFHVEGDQFKAVIQLPRFMWEKSGSQIEIPFEVTEDRRHRRSDLLYALEKQKPVTVQIFRREHKSDQWYIHLTSYIQDVPVITSPENGCLGIDFNKASIEWAYILPDGNILHKGAIPYPWKGLSSGQRQAMMWDLVAQITRIAEAYQCPIAIESLDFSKKKASMSEASKAYNGMLSNLSTGMFETALASRCKRYGIQLVKKNPAYTSVIGLIKFMRRYGLNSGTAAAMAIARRALGFSERAFPGLVRPEDQAKSPWTTWNRVARFLKSNQVRRSELFDWMKALEKFIDDIPRDNASEPETGDGRSTALCLSMQVANQARTFVQGESPCPAIRGVV